jgi:hypothetical protein
VFSVCRLVSRRCHPIDSIAQAAIDVQYYEGSDSWSVFPHAPGLSTSCVRPSPRSTAKHVMPPAHRFGRHGSVRGVFQTSPFMCRLVETSRRIAFVILRTEVSLPVASHLTSR